jgi:osmotically-inducible protein OsmY
MMAEGVVAAGTEPYEREIALGLAEAEALEAEAGWDQPTFTRVVDTGVEPRQAELLYRVAEAIDRYEPIRASLSPVQVRGREGHVVLHGRVRTLPMKVLAERLARSASGGALLISELIADDELAVAVATALAVDGRTDLSPVLVESIFGVVHLRGTVPSGAMAGAAEEVARGVPGVVRVRNELVAAPAAAPSAPAAKVDGGATEPARAPRAKADAGATEPASTPEAKARATEPVSAPEAKAEAGATSQPVPEAAFTSEPRLEPHGREQDANRVTKPRGDERVPRADV